MRRVTHLLRAIRFARTLLALAHCHGSLRVLFAEEVVIVGQGELWYTTTLVTCF